MIYHNQTEKELNDYSDYLSAKDRVYAALISLCQLGGIVVAVIMLVSAYKEMMV